MSSRILETRVRLVRPHRLSDPRSGRLLFDDLQRALRGLTDPRRLAQSESLTYPSNNETNLLVLIECAHRLPRTQSL